MFQKELGEKIIGAYPSSNYGRLSILTKSRLKIIDKFLVSPNCFFPKPKVNSMVINFKPNLKNDFGIKNINYLEKVTKILFSNKRKMINKNIKKILNMGEISSIPNLKINEFDEAIKYLNNSLKLKPDFFEYLKNWTVPSRVSRSNTEAAINPFELTRTSETSPSK